MSRRILIIAYHYPPVHVSSGVHRIVNFVRYLPEYGWDPCVLTTHPRAYVKINDTNDSLVPDATVYRAFALDTSRHLSVLGRYPKYLALPDRWSSWCLGAIPAGLWMIRKYKPDVLFSTYPIATAHLIGLVLHRLSGLPWIADFRDPMTDTDYPADPRVKAAYEWIERYTLGNCAHALFTTTDSMQMLLDKHRNPEPSRCSVISNGYDEEAFLLAERQQPERAPFKGNRPVVLIHSGTLYSSERDPLPFFRAVAELAKQGHISAETLQIRLRATGEEEYYRELLDRSGVANLIKLEEPVTYSEAIAEMLSADGLLLFQAANCNHQIPAKAYEYIRARRPVLTLTDPGGNTATLMREAGLKSIARIDSMEDIRQALISFIDQIRTGNSSLPAADTVAKYSRRQKTGELAGVLQSVVGHQPR